MRFGNDVHRRSPYKYIIGRELKFVSAWACERYRGKIQRYFQSTKAVIGLEVKLSASHQVLFVAIQAYDSESEMIMPFQVGQASIKTHGPHNRERRGSQVLKHTYQGFLFSDLLDDNQSHSSTASTDGMLFISLEIVSQDSRDFPVGVADESGFALLPRRN